MSNQDYFSLFMDFRESLTLVMLQSGLNTLETLKNLHWLPHALTCELKQIRLSMCVQLLPKLRAHAHDNWRHLITGDESRFYSEHVRD
jgi:hypothetical protein